MIYQATLTFSDGATATARLVADYGTEPVPVQWTGEAGRLDLRKDTDSYAMLQFHLRSEARRLGARYEEQIDGDLLDAPDILREDPEA